MKQYFKLDCGPKINLGIFYFEVENDVVLRQAEFDKDRWFCSLDTYHSDRGLGLSDQPFSCMEPTDGATMVEIDEKEFETAWENAVRFRDTNNRKG
ncbi:MAG: hypothetical protein L6R28_25135 [Planctomycetes bacterium]|nr:hypothetical protein [Planctomycetota bacterium]